MKADKLQNAIVEAERFIDKAKEAQDKWEEDWIRDSARLGLMNRERYTNTGKENAACKRASLDLTRSLAELRRA